MMIMRQCSAWDGTRSQVSYVTGICPNWQIISLSHFLMFNIKTDIFCDMDLICFSLDLHSSVPKNKGGGGGGGESACKVRKIGQTKRC